jgi:hypothetical protein
VTAVVLVALHEGLHELRADELHHVTLLLELSHPMMGACAGFHPDSAWRKSENHFHQLGAADAASQHKFARSIHAVHLKNILRKIDGKKPNGVDDETPINGNASSNHTPAGAVHTTNLVAQADRDARVRHDWLATTGRQELKLLRRENRQLKMERDILPQAAA